MQIAKKSIWFFLNKWKFTMFLKKYILKIKKIFKVIQIDWEKDFSPFYSVSDKKQACQHMIWKGTYVKMPGSLAKGKNLCDCSEGKYL